MKTDFSYVLIAVPICLFAVISGSYYYFVLSKKCADGEQYNAETKSCVVLEQKEILYSNLGSETANKEVETVLLSAGIPAEDVERFFAQVTLFNDTVGAFQAEAKDFKSFAGIDSYDMYAISRAWQKADFLGYNCRITSFGLLKHFIRVENTEHASTENLSFDLSVLEEKGLFNETEKEVFTALFSPVKTTLTKDKEVHIDAIKEHFASRGIRIENDKASLVSVFLHDESFAYPGEYELFIGHIGVLLPYDGKFLFVEKLAFDAPYQAIWFNSKTELKQYLLKTYNTNVDQETADPIIFENGEEL